MLSNATVTSHVTSRSITVRTVRTTDHIAPKRVGYRLRDFAIAVYQFSTVWPLPPLSLEFGGRIYHFAEGGSEVARGPRPARPQDEEDEERGKRKEGTR